MKKDLPVAVKNLRKIWEAKKVELRFTQVEAAKDLGWSQGAISHYLNNITELRAPAIVKLANFLDVDPRDIDPNIERDLPSVEKKPVAFDAQDMTKRIDETLLSRKDDSSVLVRIPHNENYSSFFASVGSDNMFTCFVRLISPSQLKKPKRYAVRLKGSKALTFYEPEKLPPPSEIHTLWSVVGFYYY